MSKKKSKKLSAQRTSNRPPAVNEKNSPKDTGLYFWMYVIGGLLMAVGFVAMYFHYTIPGLVVLVIGAILLFYGNKHTKEDPPPDIK